MRETRRYVVDTNVYIDALRVDMARSALNTFQSVFAPFVWMSAVVVQELRVGVPGVAMTMLEHSLIAPFERRERLVTPSYAAWKESGRVLSELIRPADWRTVPRSLVNDVLLALSCREAGAVLVTNNLRDFRRIAAIRPFDFIAPWP